MGEGWRGRAGTGGSDSRCPNRVPLQLADGSGTSFDLQKVPRTDRYEIPVILPDDITCPTCTLQVSQGQVFTESCLGHAGQSFINTE